MIDRAMAVLVCGIFVAANTVYAQSSVIDLPLFTDSSVLNHYPGADNLIGTADDIVSSGTAGEGSFPNSPAALSYFTVQFSGSEPSYPEFEGDVIRFQTGGLQIEATPTTKGRAFNVSILSGTLEGTAANDFIGRSVTTLGEQSGAPDGLALAFSTNTMMGTFDHTTHTPDVPSGSDTFPFPDQDIMSATVVVVKRPDFGSSGDAYMDNVVAPLVTDASVTGIFRIEFRFIETQIPDMGLNGSIIRGVLVSTTTDEIPVLTPGGGETPTPSFTLTLTPSPTVPATATPTATLTFTLTPLPTETFTDTPTLTETFTSTPSPMAATPTLTLTPTLLTTPTVTATLTAMLTCSADLDQDLDIDFQDLLIFIQQMREFAEAAEKDE